MRLFIILAALTIYACGTDVTNDTTSSYQSQTSTAAEIQTNPNKNAYFGDTHVHTVLSFDAYIMGTRRTPDEAYEFAKGAGIEHVSGFEMKMKKPLDFLMVADHAFYLGMMRELDKDVGPCRSLFERCRFRRNVRTGICGSISGSSGTYA